MSCSKIKNKSVSINSYSYKEEKLNIISHAIGVLFSIFALALLTTKGIKSGNITHIFAYSIYGLSLLTVFSASTLYHSAKSPVSRKKFKVFDHIAIYLSIAGTYTPYALITLNDSNVGTIIIVLVWSIAITGIIFKLFFTGRFKIVSTLSYLAMGWSIVIAVKPLIENVEMNGLVWLAVGGILYTTGAIIYQIKKIKFNHAIFHFMVLIAAISHVIAVYYYI
ncbi:hemolysin III family protein [Marinilabiliaceae bacterium ANBcel2]|nr:hemolysin III family protein [Marinilabiliaceae bacterium ANBcel2]